MTYKEETYLLDTLDYIRGQTKENNKLLKENNILLKRLYSYFSKVEADANNENENDFVRNILANLISNGINIRK